MIVKNRGISGHCQKYQPSSDRLTHLAWLANPPNQSPVILSDVKNLLWLWLHQVVVNQLIGFWSYS